MAAVAWQSYILCLVGVAKNLPIISATMHQIEIHPTGNKSGVTFSMVTNCDGAKVGWLVDKENEECVFILSFCHV